MTTFQAIIYAFTHGVTQFLPIGAKAHTFLISYAIDWPQPSEAFLGALALGSFLALFIYFRHDWASMISCFLQVILFRRKPMTLDERLPLFLTATSLPLICVSSYLKGHNSEVEWTPLLTTIVFAGVGIPLWFFDYFGRKIKGMCDWKWSDSIVVGVIQTAAILPGADPLSCTLIGAFFLNYKREAALKYAYFSMTPLLLIEALHEMKNVDFHSSIPIPDMSWLTLSISLIVALLSGLLAMGGLLKHVQHKGMGQYVIYRWMVAITAVAVYWVRIK